MIESGGWRRTGTSCVLSLRRRRPGRGGASLAAASSCPGGSHSNTSNQIKPNKQQFGATRFRHLNGSCTPPARPPRLRSLCALPRGSLLACLCARVRVRCHPTPPLHRCSLSVSTLATLSLPFSALHTYLRAASRSSLFSLAYPSLARSASSCTFVRASLIPTSTPSAARLPLRSFVASPLRS